MAVVVTTRTSHPVPRTSVASTPLVPGARASSASAPPVPNVVTPLTGVDGGGLSCPRRLCEVAVGTQQCEDEGNSWGEKAHARGA